MAFGLSAPLRCIFIWSTRNACNPISVSNECAVLLWPCGDLYCVNLVHLIQNVFIVRTTWHDTHCAWSKLIEIDVCWIRFRKSLFRAIFFPSRCWILQSFIIIPGRWRMDQPMTCLFINLNSNYCQFYWINLTHISISISSSSRIRTLISIFILLPGVIWHGTHCEWY